MPQPLTPGHCLQVLDDRHSPQVEQILAEAAIASAWPLAIGKMSERVLDGHALSQLGIRRADPVLPRVMVSRHTGVDDEDRREVA